MVPSEFNVLTEYRLLLFLKKKLKKTILQQYIFRNNFYKKQKLINTIKELRIILCIFETEKPNT